MTSQSSRQKTRSRKWGIRASYGEPNAKTIAAMQEPVEKLPRTANVAEFLEELERNA